MGKRGAVERRDLFPQGVARWPFVCIWDNHELSWKGLAEPGEPRQRVVPAQTRKVAANQARFE